MWSREQENTDGQTHHFLFTIPIIVNLTMGFWIFEINPWTRIDTARGTDAPKGFWRYPVLFHLTSRLGLNNLAAHLSLKERGGEGDFPSSNQRQTLRVLHLWPLQSPVYPCQRGISLNSPNRRQHRNKPRWSCSTKISIVLCTSWSSQHSQGSVANSLLY